MRFVFQCLLMAMLCAAPAAAQMSALARAVQGGSAITDAGQGIALTLSLSQPVPYAVRLLDGPPRLVIDFNEVDWSATTPNDLNQSRRVEVASAGPIRPGWSRLALVMTAPMVVESVQMQVSEETGGAVLQVTLAEADDETFRARLSAPDPGPPKLAHRPARRNDGARPLRVVLDPGHGGIDPGAERAGLREADLMLTFARELKETLRRAGVEVVMTREGDIFVPLETRISIAHAAQADILLSLHADALAEGRASGATVYTLSETASDEASAKLAERHDRADLLAGVDLSNQDDVIAGVLMDLARLENAPRSDALAEAIVAGMRKSVGGLHKRPRLRAGFSVLKSPSFPSVLIELGFLSSERDRRNLSDALWRQKAARGIRDALLAWAAEDAARAELLRR